MKSLILIVSFVRGTLTGIFFSLFPSLLLLFVIFVAIFFLSKFSSSSLLTSLFSIVGFPLFSFFFPRASTCLFNIVAKSSSTGFGLGLGLEGAMTFGLTGLTTTGGIGGACGIVGPPFTGAIATTGTLGIPTPLFPNTGGLGIVGGLGMLFVMGGGIGMLLPFGMGGACGMLLFGIAGATGMLD